MIGGVAVGPTRKSLSIDAPAGAAVIMARTSCTPKNVELGRMEIYIYCPWPGTVFARYPSAARSAMSVDTAFISDDLLFPMILICPTRNPRKQGGG